MKRIEPMKTNSKLVLAVLIGVSIGVFGILGAMVIHAQQPKVAPGYVIAEVEVTDPPTMQKYGEKVPETPAPFNHHYVLRGGRARLSRANRPNAL
jgi:hypothetical protein